MRNINTSNINKIAVCITAILLFLLLTACGTASPSPKPTNTRVATPTREPTLPAPTPYRVNLTVYPEETLQTIRDVGAGNFVHRYGGTNSALDPVSRLNIQTLSPSIARVSIDLDFWEPTNDNSNPYEINPEGFIDASNSIVRQTFDFLNAFNQLGENQVVIGSIWYLPDWMVTNPDVELARLIPEEMIPEVVESITAWLIHARDVYDVEVSYVSFNEANLGTNVLLNSNDYVTIIREAARQFSAAGIKTKWLLGDSSSMATAVLYAKRIYAAEDIRPYLGPLAFHSWDTNTSDATILEIASFAMENGLEVWCTEGGWNSNLWKFPKDFPTYTNGLNQAINYARVLKHSRASVLAYWEMMGQDYSLNDGSNPYPILSFLSELKRQIPPGAQMVKTSPDAQNVKFVAAKTENDFALLIVNRNPVNEPVIIQGLPKGSYTLLRMQKDDKLRIVYAFDVSDQEDIELELIPASINFITTRQP